MVIAMFKNASPSTLSKTLVQCSSGKLKLAGEEVGKGTSEWEWQGMRLLPVLWHEMSAKNHHHHHERKQM
jgi:hypothetical protein